MSKSKAWIINFISLLVPLLLVVILTASGTFNFARSATASWSVVAVCLFLILVVWAVNLVSFLKHHDDAVIATDADERYENFSAQTTWSVVFIIVTVLVLVTVIVFSTVVDKGALIKSIFASFTDDRITIKSGNLYALAITTVVLQAAIWFVMACAVTCDRTASFGMLRKKK